VEGTVVHIARLRSSQRRRPAGATTVGDDTCLTRHEDVGHAFRTAPHGRTGQGCVRVMPWAGLLSGEAKLTCRLSSRVSLGAAHRSAP